ncbi:hypothetical protein LOD99_3425 [Oopsacas minuta]|uniref:KASH domain-containing protein n=1 Tax=Oopsacas minuta TaxID=111878 RepID=A0AAV7JYX9_9METZ|nr:hypothetical protein LOD99_3425 [Oopsacas minuta]
MCTMNIRDYLNHLAPLSECKKLEKEQFRELYQTLREMGDGCDEDLKSLTRIISDSVLPGQINSKIDYLRDRSTYLSSIELSFKAEWSESNMENPSVLINVVSSVWLAGRKLVAVQQELRSIIILYCPRAYMMSISEIDEVWDKYYTSYDLELADSCTSTSSLVITSISKDTLVNWSDKWIDILIDKLDEDEFYFDENTPFDSLLFIAVKLHSLAGRLLLKCKDFHTCFAPRVIPALNSILVKCPAILKNFDAIKELVAKKPICNILQDSVPSYKPDELGIDVLKKRAKQFQTQYASLSDDIERYLVVCRYRKLRDHYDEIFLIRSEEDFDLNNFEESLSNIQELWDLDIEARLLDYVNQLEFLFICDKFQFELNKAREFLSQYECSKYQEFEIMSEHRKDIHNFIYSSHWIDSRQQEKSKLFAYIKKLNTVSYSEDDDSLSDDEEDDIITRKIAIQLLRIIENDFNDFTDLQTTVVEYYEEGIEQWKEFLRDVRNFDDNLSKKSYLLTNGFIKFQDSSKFPDSVRKLRSESAELEKFAEAHASLQLSGDDLCNLCDGGCQEFIQNKLEQIAEQIEEMRMKAIEVHRELDPLVRKITELEEDIKKIEDILVDTQESIDNKLEEHTKAKTEIFMDYLRSRMSSLKKRTVKLSTGCEQLEPFLNIESLDLTLLQQRYNEAEKKQTKILEFLSEKLENVILSSLDKTRRQIMFGESNLDSYETFFESLANDDFSENNCDVTKRLHDLENFFNDEYVNEIQHSIDNLIECSKELSEEVVKVELGNLEDSLSKLEITVRSTKILMHFAITYRELHEVLKLRESFIQTSSDRSYMADKLGFVGSQIEELFGEDFKICQTYYRQLRSRYTEYLSDQNQPPVLPLSLEIVSRLESRMRERLEELKVSFTDFNNSFEDVDKSITQFRKDSQNILVFAEKLEAAFTQKESSPIRDSSVLETQVKIWELLLTEGQNSLTQYDHAYECADNIYENLSPSPKVVWVKNIFPKAKEHLDQLKTCLIIFHKYQADLRANEDRLTAMTDNISHFYTEMRFPSVSINGNGTEKNEQRCDEFLHELQAITNSVRTLRIGLPELQAGAHQFVEYSIIEEKRLKILEEKLPEWQNKIDGLFQECNQNSLSGSGSLTRLEFEPQLSNESGYNDLHSFEIISHVTDHDSGAYNTPIDESMAEDCRKVQDKLTKWKRWMKQKERAHIMTSEISIKLSEAQLQKKEIDITKLEFVKKQHYFQILLADRESPKNFYNKHMNLYKELEHLFTHFEISMSKRCEEVSNRVASLFEFHLLISLCEQRLISIQSNTETVQNRQFMLEDQIQKMTDLRNELRDCERDCIDKIRKYYIELTPDYDIKSPNIEFSPDTSTESHSESDTDEKQSSSIFSNSQTSLLLPSIPCREQIQTIETKYKELYKVLTEHINSLTTKQEKANQIFNSLQNVYERTLGLINTITDQSSVDRIAPDYDSLKREYSSLEYTYTTMQTRYAPSHHESRIQLEVKESFANLQAVINENSGMDHGHNTSLATTVPSKVEFLFEQDDDQILPPLLNRDDIPPLNLSPDFENTDSPLIKCISLISDTIDFYKQFSSAGPHIENSSEALITEVQNRCTECHTEVISIQNTIRNFTGKDRVHEWLDSLQAIRDTLKRKIEIRRDEWMELVQKYNNANGYIDSLQTDLEGYKTDDWPDKAEFENAVETSADYLQEIIDGYNEFSPKMYQLIICETCEDDSCQEWRDKLNTFRATILSLKTEFYNLTHKEVIEPIKPVTIQPEIIPIEPTPSIPAANDIDPIVEPTQLIKPKLEHCELVESLPRIAPIEKPYGNKFLTIRSAQSFFYFIIHLFLVAVFIFGLLFFNYIQYATKNLKDHVPK